MALDAAFGIRREVLRLRQRAVVVAGLVLSHHVVVLGLEISVAGARIATWRGRSNQSRPGAKRDDPAQKYKSGAQYKESRHRKPPGNPLAVIYRKGDRWG